jgi:hypothetical protein
MAGDLLLVGSIPLDTPEQVFRRVGGPLGPYLAYMPEGEVGERRYWIDGIAYRVFNGHPEIETLRRPAPTRTASRVGDRWEYTTSFSSASSPGLFPIPLHPISPFSLWMIDTPQKLLFRNAIYDDSIKRLCRKCCIVRILLEKGMFVWQTFRKNNPH